VKKTSDTRTWEPAGIAAADRGGIRDREDEVWRIAAERYRNPRRGHTLMMKNVAGMRNRIAT
jgi:hypothetical protein